MVDKFRTQYRELSDDEKRQISNIKQSAGTLELAINAMTESREKSLAMTNLELAVMWSVKGITG